MAVTRERGSSTLSSQPRRRLGELFSGLYSPPSVSLAISRAACGSSVTLRLSSLASAVWPSRAYDHLPEDATFWRAIHPRREGLARTRSGVLTAPKEGVRQQAAPSSFHGRGRS